MHIPEHRFPAPEASPRPQRQNDMRSRLSNHQGWKQRVGAALLGAAGMLGAEGCATTGAGTHADLTPGVVYGGSAADRSRNQIRANEGDRTQEEPSAYTDIERTAEHLMHEIMGHRIGSLGALQEFARQADSILGRLEHDQNPNVRSISTIFTLQDVDPVTARILRRAVQNRIAVIRRLSVRSDHELSSINQDAVPARVALTILLHIREAGTLGSLSGDNIFNPGYRTPVVELRDLFNNQLADEEIVDADTFATADFVRAYAHALQRQEDQQLAQVEMERRRALRSPAGSTTDLPSGITFENQRPTPPPTPPTLRLTQNPYGDGPDQSSHHRHHRRHHP